MSTPPAPGHRFTVGVLGAGSIGCYVGGALAAAGTDVVLVARGRVRDELAAHGLTVVALDGTARLAPTDRYAVALAADALAGCGVVLCCVKSGQTAGAGAELAAALPPGALVVSAQNGLHNAEALRGPLRDQTVLGGIVGFNVRSLGDGTFRRATSGPLVIEASAHAALPAAAAALRAAGFEVEVAADIRARQWSKLVMNLNNAVSALSGAPTVELLASAGYRRVIAAVMGEALAVMRAAGVRTARVGPLPVRLFPALLGLPTPLFRVLARAQLKVDPEARSSMWEDLARGRTTEVDQLNGEIVRLAEQAGVDAPVNRRLVALVRAAEAAGAGSPKLSAEALAAAVLGA
ncbi:MAG: panE1 [Myxococcaceae bacterium]|nr:panE1 [Myxococcaceae bacterium]